MLLLPSILYQLFEEGCQNIHIYSFYVADTELNFFCQFTFVHVVNFSILKRILAKIVYWKLSTLALYSMNLHIPICLLKVTRSNHYHDALLCVQLIPVRKLCLRNKHIVTILLTKKAFLNLFANYVLEFRCWLLFCFSSSAYGKWQLIWRGILLKQNYLLYCILTARFQVCVKLQRIWKWILDQLIQKINLFEEYPSYNIFSDTREHCVHSGCSVSEGLSVVHCGSCKM